MRIFVTAFLLVFIGFEIFPVRGMGADRRTSDFHVENVRFESSGSHVTIFYQLEGPINSVYRISLVLRRSGDSLFNYIPRNLSGDIGTGRFAGKPDRIYWDTGSEIPAALTDDNYYFIVKAVKLPGENPIRSWVSLVAIAAAAAIVYLVRPSTGGR